MHANHFNANEVLAEIVHARVLDSQSREHLNTLFKSHLALDPTEQRNNDLMAITYKQGEIARL